MTKYKYSCNFTCELKAYTRLLGLIIKSCNSSISINLKSEPKKQIETNINIAISIIHFVIGFSLNFIFPKYLNILNKWHILENSKPF